MNRIAIVVGLWLLLGSSSSVAAAERASQGTGGKPGTTRKATLKVDKKERHYRLVVPKDYDPKKAMPLVFAFHGLGDSSDLMSFYSGLDKVAQQKGFILVYPNAQARVWPLLVRIAGDDLAFFDALYAHLTETFNIDLARVYLTGMSNGAFFSHLIASQRSDRVAAIAAHSGGMISPAEDPKLKQKYAVLLMHGDQDSIVNVKESRAVNEKYKRWGHTVEYLEVKGLNHFWAHKAKVNDAIWAFFEKHSLP